MQVVLIVLLRVTVKVSKKNNAGYKLVVLAMRMLDPIKVDVTESAAKVWVVYALEELLIGDASSEEQKPGR